MQKQVEIRLRKADYCDSVRAVLEAGKLELEKTIELQFEQMQNFRGMLTSREMQVADLLSVQVIDNEKLSIAKKDLVKEKRKVKFWKFTTLAAAIFGGYMAVKK